MWPGMASSGSNAEMSWDMFQITSAVAVTSNLNEFGGRKLELVKVSFDTPIRQTNTYKLHSAPIEVVRDDSGNEKTIRLTGSVLEHDGSFKIANYFVRPTAAQ